MSESGQQKEEEGELARTRLSLAEPIESPVARDSSRQTLNALSQRVDPPALSQRVEAPVISPGALASPSMTQGRRTSVGDPHSPAAPSVRRVPSVQRRSVQGSQVDPRSPVAPEQAEEGSPVAPQLSSSARLERTTLLEKTLGRSSPDLAGDGGSVARASGVEVAEPAGEEGDL
eukprot:Hpha_TRINITY_DN12927_c0_g2::TRINITY_DN12927_c0_g2_i1::g.164254::m.164254